MADIREPCVRVVPSPLPPTEAELEAWHALSRAEQVEHLREALAHPDRQRISDAKMADVLTRARKQVSARRNG